MGKSVHIIGAGKVGQTLARILQAGGAWQLSSVYSRSNGAQLVAQAGAGRTVAEVPELPPADLVLLTVSDNALAGVAEQLAGLPWLSEQTLVLHCSGSQTVGVLDCLAAKGALTGCLHPVFAFADVDLSVRTLAGSLCAAEAANAAAKVRLYALAQDLGLRAFDMPSEHKARYHAALSAASNFTVALAAFAQELLNPLALDGVLARELVAGLMRQSVDNLMGKLPLQALTGPIVRGDDSTVAAHLACMNEREREIYCKYAEETLKLAAGRLDEAGQARIRLLLEAGSSVGR